MLSVSQVVRIPEQMTWEVKPKELAFISLARKKLRGNLTKTYSSLMGSFTAGGARLFPVAVDYEVQ